MEGMPQASPGSWAEPRHDWADSSDHPRAVRDTLCCRDGGPDGGRLQGWGSGFLAVSTQYRSPASYQGCVSRTAGPAVEDATFQATVKSQVSLVGSWSPFHTSHLGPGGPDSVSKPAVKST